MSSPHSCVCIASGPSITAEDCDLVRQSGLFTICVNDSWKIAPWSNVIYAGDLVWWGAHHKNINSRAQRYTSSKNIAESFGIHYLRNRPSGMSNSGVDAIYLAVEMGFKRVLLLGYDCSVQRGSHWHGDHEKTKNPNPSIVSGWHRQFALAADRLDIEIINCSRESALECFPISTLEGALCTSRECSG